MAADFQEIDLTNEPVKNQLEFVDNAIKLAVDGSSTLILTKARIVATYALPNALTKQVKCRVIPKDDASSFEIYIMPKA